jgi:MFS family permease
MAPPLKPDDVKNSGGYRLIKELSHDEIIEFVMGQFKQLRWPMAFFYGFNIFLLGLIVAFTIGNFLYSYISWGLYWQYFLLGVVAGMLLVIPLHEMLHGLAYKLAGAPAVKYGVDLKQMMFYASAPGFVAGKYAFYLVAFSPFVLINMIFLAGILFGPVTVQWGSLVAVFMHGTMCIGDFAMVNFFAAFPRQKVYTYDDKSEKRSYFYVKR